MPQLIPISQIDDPSQSEEIPIESSEEYQELFDFEKARTRINSIIGEWDLDIRLTEQRRKERYIDVNIENLRQRGEIEEDETLVPIRVIDTNIMREKPDIMNFLKGSNRLAIFDCISDPTINVNLCRKLEIEVTKGLTYAGWYDEFDSCIDGSELHGKDYIEVVYDPSKPLHVGFEHIGFDKLYYNRKVGDIQDSEMIIRRYDLTIMRLNEFVRNNGFDPIQVQSLTESGDRRRRKDETIAIYKRFTKFQDQVYVDWYCKEVSVTGWLKETEPFQCGIKDAQTGEPSPITDYPIFPYIYKKDEQEPLVNYKGRGFLDAPIQEAQTAIASAFVNGSLRASNTYASPTTDDGETPEMKQLDVELENGGIYSKPLTFWALPWPDVTMLQALQSLSTIDAQTTGKTSFAVSNRKDSRKTAEELKLSQSQEAKITSTTLASFSEFLRKIFIFSWKIIQSQAMAEQVTLLLVQSDEPMAGGMMTRKIWKNDLTTIGQSFDIRPAGEEDVIQAGQMIQSMMQDWPVIQNTPLAGRFMQDFVRLRYPSKGEEYAKILESGDPKNLVAALDNILMKVMQNPHEIAQLQPQEMQQLGQLQQQVTQYLQVNGAPNANKPPQPTK